MKHLMIIAIGLVMGACKTTQPVADGKAAVSIGYSEAAPQVVSMQDQPLSFIPKAVVYKTNGDYNDNVAITIDAQGRIVAFPDPTDVSAESSALPLKNGWLLDRRGGVGPNTAFLRYTYSEYAQLPTVPTLDELKAAIIPDAKVTQVRQLPIPASEAAADPAKAAALL